MTVQGSLGAGQSVLVLGATGTSGRLAVGLAHHLGASVVAAGRNQAVLDALAAETSLDLAGEDSEILSRLRSVEVDYLWGRPAELVLAALAGRRRPVTYVQLGTMAAADLVLPGSVLRSTPIQLVGSGPGSWTEDEYRAARPSLLEVIVRSGLRVDTITHPAAAVADVWDLDLGGKRLVLTFDTQQREG